MAPARISPPSSPAQAQGLTAAQREAWDKNGYLIIPNALSESEVQSLLTETHAMLDGFSLEGHPMTKFSTGDTTNHGSDDYFLTSGDKIRFFFEEDAFDAQGSLTKPKQRAINKIGHYLHHLSPAFRAVSVNERNARIARDLGFRDPRVLQSMVICKQPEIGGAVPPHQDSTFLYTDPPSAVGFWYALEDCTLENGCLSFAPGSHRRAPVGSRFVRTADGRSTTFEPNAGTVWPAEHAVEEGGAEGDEKYELGEVKAGTLVLIHGNVLHKSEKNLSKKGRMIYTFHCIEGGNRYDERNWLLPPDTGFTKLNEALR